MTELVSAELEFVSRMSVLLAYNFCPAFKCSHLSTEVLIISQRIPSLSCSWALAFAVLLKGREVEQRTGHSRSLVPSMPFPCSNSTSKIIQTFSHSLFSPNTLLWKISSMKHPCMYPPSRFYNEDFAVFSSYLSISSYLYSSTWSI